MKLLAAALVLLASACAGPKPCTRTLCVARLDGTMEISGWSGSVRATSDTPKPPVMSDSEVRMIYGKAELVNGMARVTAEEGSVFKFTVSTKAVPSIEVSSGVVSVWPTPDAPVAIAPGTPYDLPVSK